MNKMALFGSMLLALVLTSGAYAGYCESGTGSAMMYTNTAVSSTQCSWNIEIIDVMTGETLSSSSLATARDYFGYCPNPCELDQ